MAERQHRRVASGKASAYWSRRIDTELFDHPDEQKVKSEKKGRWDPYERFTKQEDLTRFFSGHSYRRYSLVDRECFAKFAINKTLGDYPEHKFQITGEIMKNESVSVQQGDPGALADLVEEIRAGGQQDVDAEFTRDLNSRPSKSDDYEATQKISAAAQAIMAASPNSLGPPIEPCAAYLKMTKCGQYGRNKSAVWRSPLLANLDNEDGRRGLLDHQVTGVVWLLSRLFGDLPTLKYKDPDTGRPCTNIQTPFDAGNRDRLRGPKYFGGILADSMGLGKTLITVALMDLLVSQRLNVLQAEDGNYKHRPILLLTPNATVASQWVQEISQVIDESTIRNIVVSGPGLEAPPDQYRVVHLGRDNFKQWPAAISYMWDEDDARASQVVLIMTMESWAGRTCIRDTEDMEWLSSFTDEGRAFSLVIVDEAYKVKNPSTRNWRSVYLLERQFTLLITATPCMNTLTDLFGLARLLWSEPETYLKQNPSTWKHIETTFRDLEDLEILDGYDASHDYQLVAGRPALLARLLCKNRNARTQDIDLTRKYLRHFETLAMLKRSPSSHIYADWGETKPISLEGLFPKVENYTVDISLGEAYDREYQKVHIDVLIDYLQGLKDWAGVVVVRRTKKEKKEDEEAKAPVTNAHRLLQLAASSLDVYDLDRTLNDNGRSTLAPDVAEMRDKGVNLLRLSQFLVPLGGTKPETHVDFMKVATRNSPILQYILHYINDNILTREENGPIKKLLIVEHSLVVAFYYELVLQFLGFECRCMHAQLSIEERQELVDSFNSSDNNSCQILIQLYTVGFAGTNLHKSCSRVLVASQSHSLQVQWQAIYRVIRVGQNSDVTIHRLKLKNSYHAFRESRQIEKILPELGARAQGNTKKVLVRLLNLFQYEIHDAWHSPEGQKLMKEKNLLDDEEGKVKEQPDTSDRKRIKLENGSKVKVEGKRIKVEDEDEANSPGNLFVSNHSNTRDADASTGSNSHKRERVPVTPKPGNGSAGWFNNKDDLSDDDAFLEIRTRDDYYQEFIELPRRAKSLFSHAKNNLRRLLSYGNDNGNLSTVPWNEDDLANPAVLERSLELMLRVRLGANDIAMLPFPLVDLSRAPKSRRKELQRLLADMVHTDQEFDEAVPVAAVKDLKESLKGSDVKKSLAQIDKDLEAQARYGDADAIAKHVEAKKVEGKKTEAKKVKKPAEVPVIDLTEEQYEDDADSQSTTENRCHGQKKIKKEADAS
ncbi:P-loop containing nucleoside triphosphate hydrolase protein [Xylariaceae sp. AK1471]|nr:P-loop containing nucleoside triphosphate hydrolase protein [Xylariaceae sp. AK1471]